MPNTNGGFAQAKKGKNDEFYTQYEDIQREVNYYLDYNQNIFKDKTILLPCDDPEWSNFTKFFAQNFEMFGLKKLISTSYATNSKNVDGYQFSLEDFLTDFEKNSIDFNEKKSFSRGKIFTLTRKNKKVDIDDLKWKYLEEDGDFRSEEVKELRDEADIIITNPPFSLFKEFLSWINPTEKKFLIIGNQNAITNRDTFNYIKNGDMWLGRGFKRNCAHFINKIYQDTATDNDHREGMIRVSGVYWYTNIDHGRRHQAISLMTMNDNLRYSKHDIIRTQGYQKYLNFDAIHIPFSDSIPSDYDGFMGVPITFMDKYCPEQFEIIGNSEELAGEIEIDGKLKKRPGRFYTMVDNKPHREYDRIVIRRRNNG